MYTTKLLLTLILFASCTQTSGFIAQSRTGLISLMSRKPRLESLSCEPRKRKIVKYDNVGDPIYEGEDGASPLKIDGFSATAIVFGLIAFNFFVLANADMPQFNLNFF